MVFLSPAHSEQPVYNVARPRGFFSGSTMSAGFSAITSSELCFIS